MLQLADARFPSSESSALAMARLDIAHRRAVHRGDLLHVSRLFRLKTLNPKVPLSLSIRQNLANSFLPSSPYPGTPFPAASCSGRGWIASELVRPWGGASSGLTDSCILSDRRCILRSDVQRAFDGRHKS